MNAQIDTFRDRPPAAPRLQRMTIIAQDPDFTVGRRIVTAQVDVPADRLEPGPRTHRFHVVDYDATTGVLAPPADITDLAGEPGWSFVDRFAAPDPDDPGDEARRFPDGYDQTLRTDAAFHAQNTYAIAARTLAAFEFALGRRLDWAFDGPQLYLVPHAVVEGNAYYARRDKGVFFGYLPQLRGPPVFTCLSHDVVAHETTHAILDGLRPRFLEPALPDQLAFHEALGDIVALLSVFSLRELVSVALNREDPRATRIKSGDVSREVLARSVLVNVAEQFGEAVSGVRGSALRRSLELIERPDRADLLFQEAFDEPHRRGEILVAAVLDTLLGMWIGRLEALIQRGRLDRARAAEEGAKAAAHLLTMVIRSLDYAPSVEIEFDDVLDAILVADETVAPDDEHGYRDALRRAFGQFGITQPTGRLVDCSTMAIAFRYEQINAAALRTSRQEAFRFIWQNLAALGLSSEWHLQVESLRPAVRIGPDGLVIQELIADYVQVVEMSAAEARARGAQDAAAVPVAEPLIVPERINDDVSLQLWGGGVLVFDQFGRLKLHQHKRLDDWGRQTRRLAHLAGRGLYDRLGLGFSLGAAPFAEMHRPNARAGETW